MLNKIQAKYNLFCTTAGLTDLEMQPVSYLIKKFGHVKRLLIFSERFLAFRNAIWGTSWMMILFHFNGVFFYCSFHSNPP